MSEQSGIRRLEVASAALCAAGFLLLSTNRFPVVPIGLLSLGGLLALAKCRWPEPATRVAAIWAFWILSFLLTLESPKVLASFDFQRRDGQIFFSIWPLFTLPLLSLGRRPVILVLAVFCGFQAGVAVVATGFDVVGAREAASGLVFLHDERPEWLNYCGLYRAHNAVGSVQALCCLVSAVMAVFESGRRKRLMWGGFSVLLLLGVILSESRGSLIALVGGLVLLLVIGVRRRVISRRACIGAAGGFVLMLLVAGPGMLDKLGKLSGGKGTHVARLELWKRGIREWSWSPVVGIGMGRYNDTDREWSGIKGLYYVATDGTVVNNHAHAHNSYIQFLAEGGLVGLSVVVWLWGWLAWRLRRAREPIRVAALVGILYLFAISVTEHYMGGGIMHLILACIVGAAWNLPEPDAPQATPDSTKPPPSGTLSPR